MDGKRQKMTLWNKFKDKGKVAPPKPTYVSRDNIREFLRIFNAEIRIDSRKKSVKAIILVIYLLKFNIGIYKGF